MKIYTTTDQLPYNAQNYTVLSETGQPLQAVVFEDEQGIAIYKFAEYDLALYSENKQEFFFPVGQLPEEDGGHFVWESVAVINQDSQDGTSYFFLENGDAVVENNGKHGLFLGVGSIEDYTKQYA